MRRGFTLIEAIMVITLVGITSFVIALYIREGFDAWKFISGQKSMALSSRAAIYRIVRELKRAQRPGATTFITIASTEVEFLDIDNKKVNIKQDGTNLVLRYGNDPSNVLLENLQDPGGLLFIYLDKDGNPTAIKSSIKVVRARITAVDGENKFVIESVARVRVIRL